MTDLCERCSPRLGELLQWEIEHPDLLAAASLAPGPSSPSALPPAPLASAAASAPVEAPRLAPRANSLAVEYKVEEEADEEAPLEATPAELRELWLHAQGCEDCRRSLSILRAARQVLVALPAQAPPPELRARIQSQLQAQLSSAPEVQNTPATVGPGSAQDVPSMTVQTVGTPAARSWWRFWEASAGAAALGSAASPDTLRSAEEAPLQRRSERRGLPRAVWAGGGALAAAFCLIIALKVDPPSATSSLSDGESASSARDSNSSAPGSAAKSSAKTSTAPTASNSAASSTSATSGGAKRAATPNGAKAGNVLSAPTPPPNTAGASTSSSGSALGGASSEPEPTFGPLPDLPEVPPAPRGTGNLATQRSQQRFGASKRGDSGSTANSAAGSGSKSTPTARFEAAEQKASASLRAEMAPAPAATFRNDSPQVGGAQLRMGIDNSGARADARITQDRLNQRGKMSNGSAESVSESANRTFGMGADSAAGGATGAPDVASSAMGGNTGGRGGAGGGAGGGGFSADAARAGGAIGTRRRTRSVQNPDEADGATTPAAPNGESMAAPSIAAPSLPESVLPAAPQGGGLSASAAPSTSATSPGTAQGTFRGATGVNPSIARGSVRGGAQDLALPDSREARANLTAPQVLRAAKSKSVTWRAVVEAKALRDIERAQLEVALEDGWRFAEGAARKRIVWSKPVRRGQSIRVEIALQSTLAQPPARAARVRLLDASAKPRPREIAAQWLLSSPTAATSSTSSPASER